MTRGKINREVKAFKELRATPDEIRRRADAFRTMWPTFACTAPAILKHWDQFPAAPRARAVSYMEREGSRISQEAKEYVRPSQEEIHEALQPYLPTMKKVAPDESKSDQRNAAIRKFRGFPYQDAAKVMNQGSPDEHT